MRKDFKQYFWNLMGNVMSGALNRNKTDLWVAYAIATKTIPMSSEWQFARIASCPACNSSEIKQIKMSIQSGCLLGNNESFDCLMDNIIWYVFREHDNRVESPIYVVEIIDPYSPTDCGNVNDVYKVNCVTDLNIVPGLKILNVAEYFIISDKV